jgi:hypothetical protein
VIAFARSVEQDGTRIFSISFGISSGPGALEFGSFIIVCSTSSLVTSTDILIVLGGSWVGLLISERSAWPV